MTEPLNASKNPLATSRNWRIGSIVLFAMSLSAATLIGVGTGNVLLALGTLALCLVMASAPMLVLRLDRMHAQRHLQLRNRLDKLLKTHGNTGGSPHGPDIAELEILIRKLPAVLQRPQATTALATSVNSTGQDEMLFRLNREIDYLLSTIEALHLQVDLHPRDDEPGAPLNPQRGGTW